MPQCIVFTGGGTAGHVTPNLPLIDAFKKEGWDVHYIGSSNGVEQRILERHNLPFHSVSSGKLRRYLSWKNLSDPFKLLYGIFQSLWLLYRIKPDVVFSKGGFVAVPVVIAAWLLRIPVVAHESDMTPGLANRLCFPFVKKICLTFEAASQHFKNKAKLSITGTPIREQLFQGNRARGLDLCHFKEGKPCLLVIGGSLGAQSINQCLREALPELSKAYQIIHLCGRGKMDDSLKGEPDYQQFEFVDEELSDLFAASDLVLSRSGANALYEILALEKPHLLVPLSKKASRGDQIQNARYFEKQGVSYVINDEDLTPERLIKAVSEVMSSHDHLVAKIKALGIASATSKIVGIIKEQVDD